MESKFYEKAKQDNEAWMKRLSKNRNASGENSLERLVKRLNQDHIHTLILSVKKLKNGKNCMKDSLLRSIFVLDGRIPKHMVTLGEKYLRRCLVSVHISASSSISTYNTRTDYSSIYTNPAEIRSKRSPELRGFVFDSPSPKHWIVGSIMDSESMVNIMNSPLFTEFGVTEDETQFKGLDLNDVEGSVSCDFTNSPPKPGKDTLILQNHRYESDTAHDRVVSMSNAYDNTTHAVLQCVWKSGVPEFIFSLDDQKGSYVANLWKTDSPDYKARDFVYLFHSKPRIHGMESQIVGKMKISSSFTLSENNSKIMEREFVLFGCNEKIAEEAQISRKNSIKNKGLSKVVKVLKISHSSKLRSFKFKESSPTLENHSLDAKQAPGNDQATILDNEIPTNLELAAIVVKEHLSENHKEKKVGGWGLNFLKNSGCSTQNSGVCTSSMDVLVPVGFHGGPTSVNCGPSSLIERWRSGGHCDCGGWDLGCQMKVLKTKEETSPQAGTDECCRFIDLFIKGSEHGAPTLRLVNVRDGLYFVHFQPALSVLQSFSMAVAYVHSQSPTLRPINPEELS
ncbi:hypothetical protein ACFE04_015254 [Oxalis oulophora]